jgi:Holliday junction resolvase RusA-like endonuclease
VTVTHPWTAAVVQLYGPPVLDVTVPTIPAGQGSMKSIGPGKPLVPDSSKLEPWRDAVIMLARSGWRGRPTLTGPVEVHVLFALPKPVSAPKNWREIPDEQYPTRHGTGDVDKLARAILDALTKAKIYKDDAGVTDLVGRKRFADGPGCHLTAPGAHILLWPLP